MSVGENQSSKFCLQKSLWPLMNIKVKMINETGIRLEKNSAKASPRKHFFLKYLSLDMLK